MNLRVCFCIFIVSLSSLLIQGRADREISIDNSKPITISPFSSALQILQKQLGYDFQIIGRLRRAMTHPSFSGENNKALSILGLSVIETSVSLRLLGQNIDMSSKDLNRWLTKISEVNSCASEGLSLGLQRVVRVSVKTNSSAPAVVCGAYRAIFGAISVDSGTADVAGKVFWSVHGDVGRAFAAR